MAIGRRRAARLADAHAQPRQHELQVAARQAAQRRHARPGDQRAGEDVAAVAVVGEPGDGNAERDVEQCQGRAGEEGDAAVAEVQIEAHRLHDRGHHIAVGDADRVDQAHDAEYVPAQRDRRHSGAGDASCGDLRNCLPLPHTCVMVAHTAG
jgi:hypothetical protein